LLIRFDALIIIADATPIRHFLITLMISLFAAITPPRHADFR
jgi:hypothetical protein